MSTTRRAGVGAVTAVLVLAIAMLIVVPHRAGAAAMLTRLQGADRYETAAAVSAKAFQPNVPVAYLASGESFADALAAGPAAARGGGPVLLTQPGALPTSTATELNRLKPGAIVIVGGTTAVSSGVQTAVQQYTTGSVTRVSGADRYDTAGLLATTTFNANLDTVVVATGQNFPDALSGAPVAFDIGSGGPLLLVRGQDVPGSTVSALSQLHPQHIVVLGGPNVISDTVKSQLGTYSPSVTRRAGSDRYATSVDLSSFFYASATTVYLATGTNFPDALAAGSPAGIARGPVLLSRPDCIPKAVNDEINRLNPTNVYLLGGAAALSDAVMGRTVCPITTGDVMPGTFCSPEGDSGLTKDGTPMTCANAMCNGTPYTQPRWRKTDCST
jgi:putative cell wall-binding protein